MTKSFVTVTIEVSIIEEARKKNINISQAAEEGIKAACGGKIEGIIHKPSKIERVESKMTKSNREGFIITHERGYNCKSFVFRETGIKINDEEVLDLLNKWKEKNHVR